MAIRIAVLKAFVCFCIAIEFGACHSHSTSSGGVIDAFTRIQNPLQLINLEQFIYEEYGVRKNMERSSLEHGYDNQQCIRHLEDWRSAFDSSELWAIQGDVRFYDFLQIYFAAGKLHFLSNCMR